MSKTILSYPIFILAFLAVIAVFITTTTYTQLAIGILLYPLLVFFAYKLIPTQIWVYNPKKRAVAAQPQVITATAESVKTQRDSVGISDLDKRVFLKLIGGAGVALFLFSLFNKRTATLFSRGMPTSGTFALTDTTGNKIDPAQNQPLDGYKISEVDDNFITYYGFIDKSGAWFVMRADPDTGSFRYSKGGTNFQGNWSNRENLKYDYYNSVF